MTERPPRSASRRGVKWALLALPFLQAWAPSAGAAEGTPAPGEGHQTVAQGEPVETSAVHEAEAKGQPATARQRSGRDSGSRSRRDEVSTQDDSERGKGSAQGSSEGASQETEPK